MVGSCLGSGFQPVSNESREYEDLMNTVTSGYLDASSAACFTYSSPRLINNELLEKEVRGGRAGIGAFCNSLKVHAVGSRPL